MRTQDMVQRKIQKIIKVILIGVVAVAVFGFVVEGLWNSLMPALFGWHAVTFWQAVGLLLLSKIFFGGFRGGPGRGMHWRGRMREKWAQMSPEEQERFSRGMRGRFGGRGCWPEAGKAEPQV
jgi:Ca2+/H+ antiporter, TMEM165/GDT1 family